LLLVKKEKEIAELRKQLAVASKKTSLLMQAKLMSTPPSINESFDSLTKESLFTDTLTPTESHLLIKPQN